LIKMKIFKIEYFAIKLGMIILKDMLKTKPSPRE